MSSVSKPPQLRARVVPFALSQVTMSSHSLKPIMSRIDSILATELPDDWLIDAQRLKLVSTGNWSHAAPVRGEVSRVFCDTMDSDRMVAVRHLNKLVDLVPASSDSTPAPESRLIAAVIRQEAALMRRLAEGSPRFVNFIGIVTVSSESRIEQPAVVLEWMSRGSLHQCIFGNDKQQGISDENAEVARMQRLPPMATLIRIAVQIAEGLRHLHMVMKTVHRSLSSHHVLLNDDWEVKLTGCSMMKDLATCVSTSANDVSHALSPFVFGHAKGDARSQPPELLSSDECLPSAASDLFAFGVVLFEMFTARRAWHNVASDHAVAARVIAGARPPIPVRVPPKIRDAIEKCWSPEPAARGSIDDILDLLSIAAHNVSSE
jgi:serine/threonine protein kinase